MTETTTEYLNRRRKEVLDQADAIARQFFDGTEQEIPDLEFETPRCPICDLHTDYDDGLFVCDICGVTWPNSGYGKDAEKIDGHPMHEGRTR